MGREEEVKRAKQLNGLDVRGLIKTVYPALPSKMTGGQLDHLQRGLDVEVINTAVEAEFAELDRKSIKGITDSNRYLRDPVKAAEAQKVLKKKVAVGRSDHVVRLDLEKLVAADAFKPTSDNPDEAAYLLHVLKEYQRLGVWLRITQDNSAMARNLHPNPNDPKHWWVQLILGYDPTGVIEPITTDSGILSRQALLSVQHIGAGYGSYVHYGPTLTLLKESIDRVQAQLILGRGLHNAWAIYRIEAKPGVVWTSDKLGGATWPDESIWNMPSYALNRALHLINAGQLIESSKFVVFAAFLVDWNARAVHEYVAKTTDGAKVAVKILSVVAVAGKIAEGILLVLSVGAGLIRLLSTRGGAELAGAATRGELSASATSSPARQLPAPATSSPARQLPAPRTPTPASNAPAGRTGTIGATPYTAPPAKPLGGNRGKWGSAVDMEDVINKVRVRNGMKPLPKKTLAGPVDAYEEGLISKAHQEYLEWLRKNPDASLERKFQAHDEMVTALRRKLGRPLD